VVTGSASTASYSSVTEAPRAIGPVRVHVIDPPPVAPAPVSTPPLLIEPATTTPGGTVSTTTTSCAPLTSAAEPFVTTTV
jgi:hypothetical protein